MMLQRRAMTRRFIIAVAALALLAIGTTSAHANAVTDWNAITQDALIPGRPAGDAQVMVGIDQAAVFDAANAIEGGYTPYGGAIDAPRKRRWHIRLGRPEG